MKRLLTYGTLLLLLGIASCDNWLDVNYDPNNPSEVEYEDLLASGISSVAYVMGGKYQVLGALWAQHWTQSPGASQYSGIDSYDINSSTFDANQFGELYAGALKNLEEIRQRATAEKEWNYVFVATVMQVYVYQVLADLYDALPLNEGLQGELGNMAPHWQTASEVYDSLFLRLDRVQAVDLDEDELKVPAGNDLLFGGDMDKWREFSNTLELKMYLRLSEVNPAKAQMGIEELFNQEAGFLTGHILMTQFSNETGRRNPLYETEVNTFGNNPNLVLSRTYHSYLQENGDYDRLDAMFATPASGGDHKSAKQGDYNPQDEPSGINSSSYSKPYMSATFPVFLMSYMESCFLQAEAMIRYNVAPYRDAKEKYEEGILYGLSTWLYDGTNAAQVIAKAQSLYQNGSYRFPPEGAQLEQFIEAIIVQKWVALAGIQSLETFFEHNRTHYPVTTRLDADADDYIAGQWTVAVNNVTSGRFPKRLIIPESEIAGNPHAPEKKEVWEPVWWDVKAISVNE